MNNGITITTEDVVYIRISAKDFLPSLRKNKRKPNIGFVTATSIIGFGLLMLMLLLLISSLLIGSANCGKYINVPSEYCFMFLLDNLTKHILGG